MSEPGVASEQLFFDPFAEKGEEFFDPIDAHEKMWDRYSNKEIAHDYSADEFLADTQALMMDAQFVGRFEEAERIAERMHILCGEDHELQRASENNHTHDSDRLRHNHEHDETHDNSADKKKKSDKKEAKKKKLKRLSGWALLGITTKPH